MRSSSSHIKRAMSVKDNDFLEGESPLHNFVKAKKKINTTFEAIKSLLEETNGYLSECKIADEHEAEVDKVSAEVSA